MTGLATYLMALGALRVHFIYSKAKQQTIPGTTKACIICATKTLQGRTGALAEDGHHNPTRRR